MSRSAVVACRGQRVGDGVVDVGAAEQFLFHLAPERRADLCVAADVGEGLVEALRDDGQAAGRVQDVARAFLDQQDVVGFCAEGVGGADNGGEG